MSRPATWLRPALLAAALVGLLTPVLPRAAASSGCLDADEQRNRWNAIAAPSGERFTALAQLDGGTCTLVAVGKSNAVLRSEDGGRHWVKVGSVPAAGRLWAESLPPDTVLFAPSAPAGGAGLLISTDRGATFSAVSGLGGAVVGSIVASKQDRTTLYATVGAPSTSPPVTPPVPLPVPLPGVGASSATSIVKSTDGGRSWGPVPGSAAFTAIAVAPDAESASTIYAAAAGQAGGVWVSTNGGNAFTRAATVSARDVMAVHLPGGGSELYVATDAGIQVSRDGATTFDTKQSAYPVTSLRGEGHQADSLMFVTGAAVRRSTDTARTSRDVSVGLPSDCRPGALSTAPQRVPTTFFVQCASGEWLRYRSDGSDIGNPDDPGNPGLPGTSSQQPVPMRVLKSLRQRVVGDGNSGSVAFDGDYLYYSSRSELGVLHRTDVLTGEPGTDIVTPVHAYFEYLTYDARRHHMFAFYFDANSSSHILDIALRTGESTERSAPVVPDTEIDGEGTLDSVGSLSYDASTDHFFVTRDHGLKVFEFDSNATFLRSCVVPIPSGLGAESNGITIGPPGLASVVASGDGSLYVELEDDSTLMRIDRACHLLGVFGHEGYPEAGDENDAIACDTVTFPGTAALWLRDGHLGRFTAYEIPGGYCALLTSLSLHKTAVAPANGSSTVCATLRRTGTGAPIGGQQIELFVAQRAIGTALTDATGIGCHDYRPIARELPALARPGTSAGIAAHALVASFVGTIGYRPSSDHGVMGVRGLVAGEPPIPPVPLPPPPPPAVPVAVVPPPLGPPPPPQPPVPPAGQPQPIAQGHPGAQPGAMGAPGGAMAPEDEVEVEAQGADTGIDSFTALAATPAGIFAGGLLGLVVWQRRRKSRVVGSAC